MEPRTFHQHRIEASNSGSPQRTVKFCKRCGGEHAGYCDLVATSHGTLCRPELLEMVEQRFREALPA